MVVLRSHGPLWPQAFLAIIITMCALRSHLPFCARSRDAIGDSCLNNGCVCGSDLAQERTLAARPWCRRTTLVSQNDHCVEKSGMHVPTGACVDEVHICVTFDEALRKSPSTTQHRVASDGWRMARACEPGRSKACASVARGCTDVALVVCHISWRFY